MIKTTIDAGVPFNVGPWEMLVVESTTYTATSVAGCLAATAMREPIALIVRYPDGDRAFDLEGRDIVTGATAAAFKVADHPSS